LAVCLSGIAAEFEAKVLVEALKQVREAIGITKEKEVFKPEYLKGTNRTDFIRRESPFNYVEAV